MEIQPWGGGQIGAKCALPGGPCQMGIRYHPSRAGKDTITFCRNIGLGESVLFFMNNRGLKHNCMGRKNARVHLRVCAECISVGWGTGKT